MDKNYDDNMEKSKETEEGRVHGTEFWYQENSCFLQFWECCASENSDENGCYFLLTDQLPVSNIRDNRLEAYRWTCLNDKYRFVGREKNVGDWFAGRAAQTQVADYQYNSEALGLGQLVMPVYFNHSGAVLKLAGIIELVTAQHNEFYAAYFNQIQSSLMEVNLTSTDLGKTIKVEYNQQLVKFTLPFSANLPDLQEQVTMRFKELENKAFSIVYKDTNHIRHSILSDHDLQFCIAESILNRTALIRMDVVDVVHKFLSVYHNLGAFNTIDAEEHSCLWIQLISQNRDHYDLRNHHRSNLIVSNNQGLISICFREEDEWTVREKEKLFRGLCMK
nr:hypothetical protein [Tanacetum cinerariifolium]